MTVVLSDYLKTIIFFFRGNSKCYLLRESSRCTRADLVSIAHILMSDEYPGCFVCMEESD